MSPAGTRPQYAAFISYAHADEGWAKWLQRAIEHYRVPSRLRGTEGAHGPVPERLRPVFRDRDELAAGAELSDTIQQALIDSASLVVVCSPVAAKSKWVNEEILAWKRLGNAARILALIVDGEPGDPDLECFPPALRFQLDEGGELSDIPSEPIAADARRGKDGKKLARLKMLAGLLGVGLDELRQREAARRQRVLAGVATASLAGMAFTGWLAWTAMQARDDAERRQAQAEDLVDFMLTDLRDQLESVGRLDAMEATADKALEYFSSLPPRDLTEDALEQRGRALRQLGQFHQDRLEYDRALAAYEEALAMDRELLARAPDDPQRLFNLGQSEFWPGYVAYDRGDWPLGLAHFERYLEISQSLYDLDPRNADWVLELSYAHANLAATHNGAGQTDAAISHIEQAVRFNREALALATGNRDIAAELGATLAWQGTVLRSAGQLDDALASRRAARELYQGLLAGTPDDAPLLRSLGAAWRGEGVALASVGQAEEAREAFEASRRIFSRLEAIDPSNGEWVQMHSEVLADVVMSHPVDFEPSGADVGMLAQRVDAAPEGLTAEFAAEYELSRAIAGWSLVRAGDEAGREVMQRAVRQIDDLVGESVADPGIVSLRAQVHLLALQSGIAPGDSTGQALLKGIEVARETGHPKRLANAARLAIALDRLDDASPLVERLQAMGYREAMFMAECREAGLCEAEQVVASE